MFGLSRHDLKNMGMCFHLKSPLFSLPHGGFPQVPQESRMAGHHFFYVI